MEDRHVGIDLSTYDSTITNDLSNDSEDTNRTNLSPRPPPPRRMPPRGLTRSKVMAKTLNYRRYFLMRSFVLLKTKAVISTTQ